MTESVSTKRSLLSPKEAVGQASDEALLSEWRRSGAQEPVAALVQRYLKPVRRFVFQMVLHDAAADDLTQEVFLRAVRGMEGFAGRAKFSTWLFQIASNVATTHLKTNLKNGRAARDAASSQQRRSHEPVDHLLQQESIRAIESAMNELSPKHRAALVLTCLHGMTAEQVSEIEGCQVATIYSRVHEARKQLKHSLERFRQ
ncbi:RNA polymerase sigma factor [Planctomicrobium sp. SH661]|uniref:RNA polymerase sigma factor n=1 Tax=Planctomicrobium sp. SH661 TaxID=3448124 RepID=UPI003F5B6476